MQPVVQVTPGQQHQPAVIPGPVSSGQPIIIQLVQPSKTSSGCSSVKQHYKSKLAVIAAGSQLFLGALSIAMTAAAYAVDASSVNHIAYGIWSPIIWFVAGGFGIASSCSKTQCTIITTMVMSIISAVTILYYLPLASVAVNDDESEWRKYDEDWGDYRCTERTHGRNCAYEHDPPLKILEPDWSKRMAFGSILIVVSVLEGIVAIVASALCCKVLCCGASNQQVQQSNVRYVSANPSTEPMAGVSAIGYQEQPREIEKRLLAEPMNTQPYGRQDDPPPPYNPDSYNPA